MSNKEIMDLQRQIMDLSSRLAILQKANSGDEVPNYPFETLSGSTTLLNLFAGQANLLMIHNMGQGCRYCTLWADGFNGLLAHLESAFAVVVVSKDSPAQQRLFANSRGWRFRMASHGGAAYISEQSVMEGANNMPGAVLYTRNGNKILRKNTAVFGPGDQYCSMWNLLSLAGLGESDWTPQFRYWQRPEKLDDGGMNVED